MDGNNDVATVMAGPGAFQGGMSALVSEALESLASHRVSLSFFDAVAQSLPDALSSEKEFQGSPIALDLFGARFSAAAVQTLNSFSRDEEWVKFASTSLKLLNRNDLTGTFRYLEREVFLRATVLRVIDVLLERKPQLVVFGVTPHEFLPYVVQNVAGWLGIPSLFFQPSSLAPAMIARLSLREFFVPHGYSVGESSVGDHLRAVAQEKLNSLLQGTDPAYMSIQRDRDLVVASPRHRVTNIRSTLLWLFRDRFPTSVDLTGHNHRHGIFSRGFKILATRSLQNTLKRRVFQLGEAPMPDSPYCVFALHYEPERTSIPEGYPILFQGDAIAASRSLVPESHALVVKEHYSQQSAALRGFAGRSPLFYDLVENFQNTFFSPTQSKLIELVEGADCVFTLTGTIAIEAVLRGVRVGFYGSPWWEGLPGAMRITHTTTYGDLMAVPIPEVREVQGFIDSLVSSAMIPGLAGESVKTIEKRLGPLPGGFAEAEAHAVAACILEILKRKET